MDNVIRMVPQDFEAEENVLGAILIQQDTIKKIIPICNQDDFYREKHRILFLACIALDEAHEPIDAFTLKTQLEKTNHFETIGGSAFIALLTDRVPTAANVEFYAKRVKEKSDARKLLNATTQIQTEV